MKIISNFKDYYDFLQGEYGIDPKAVYERVCKDASGHKISLYVPEFLRPRPFFNNEQEEQQYDEQRKQPRLYMLAICGRIYCATEQNGVLMHGPQAWPDNIDKEDIYLHLILKKNKKLNDMLSAYPEKLHRDLYKYHLRTTDLNEKHLCPVILLEEGTEFANILNPRLSDFQFAKVIPPKELFLMITDFLLKERPMQEKKVDPKERNKQRILAHGFDLKKSFRKDKK